MNLKGSYVAAQEFGMQLIKLGRPGKIINIASFTSYVAMTQVSAYAATKGGVVQMTRAFSNEWAHHGIQVGKCFGFYCHPVLSTNDGKGELYLSRLLQDSFSTRASGYIPGNGRVYRESNSRWEMGRSS